MPVNMFKLRETFVRKSKISSTKGFTSPAKPANPKNPTKQDAKANVEVKKDDESVFDLGDGHFGAFGDMQDQAVASDDDFEEVSFEDFDENSEYSERTVNEEEYNLYVNTIDIHQIQDFEEWRKSEHFPQHLFDDSGDEYDEITVDSDEFQQSLSNGGLVIDWTGTRITLDSYGEKDAKEKKKKKKKKKTTKIKVKKSKKSSKHSASSGTKGESSDKKKRKSEKREKSSKDITSPASSETHQRHSLKSKLSKETSVAKLSNDEDSSRGSSLLLEGPKRNSSKERSKRRSSKLSLNGSSDSFSLNDPHGQSPVSSRAVRRQSKSKRRPSETGDQGLTSTSTDDTGSMSSSFDIPESMRSPRPSKDDQSSSDYPVSPRQPQRLSMTGSSDGLKSPKSPHARSSPAGRRGGRKSSSKANLWADSMAAISKPELSKSVSDSADAIPRRSTSRRSSTQSPKRRTSVETSSLIQQHSSSNPASPIPRHSLGNAASPIPRRSSSRRMIIKSSSMREDLDFNSEHIPSTPSGRRRSNGRKSAHDKQRTNSLGELEVKSGRLIAARDKLANLSLDDPERSPNEKTRQPEKRKSERLVDLEREAREGAERSNSIGALERRKGSHAAMREKLTSSDSDGAMKQKYSEEKPRRASSFDTTKTKDRRRNEKSEDGSTGSGLSDEKVSKQRSLSVGITGESRRMLRKGHKRESFKVEASCSDSLSSLEASKTSFDPFGVAVDAQQRNSASFLGTSERGFDTSERSHRSVNTLVRKPSKVQERVFDSGVIRKPSKMQDDLRLSNHGKGPVSLLSPRSGRKKAQPPKRRSSGNAPLKRHSLQTVDTGISSKDVTW